MMKGTTCPLCGSPLDPSAMSKREHGVVYVCGTHRSGDRFPGELRQGTSCLVNQQAEEIKHLYSVIADREKALKSVEEEVEGIVTAREMIYNEVIDMIDELNRCNDNELAERLKRRVHDAFYGPEGDEEDTETHAAP